MLKVANVLETKNAMVSNLFALKKHRCILFTNSNDVVRWTYIWRPLYMGFEAHMFERWS